MSTSASSELPPPPRLPERAAIYIAPDGTVQFGALFEGLVPVAESLQRPAKDPEGAPREREDSDVPPAP